MIIGNTAYSTTDLGDVLVFRHCIFNLFQNNNYIQQLKDIISRHIDCLEIRYDQCTFTFYIKIKKTAMRKCHGFNHDPIFYYSKIQDIYKEFISCNENYIIPAVTQELHMTSPNEVSRLIYERSPMLANLCHVSCISDNVVVIRL